MPTVHVRVTQLDHSASRAGARDHRLTIDRPEATMDVRSSDASTGD